MSGDRAEGAGAMGRTSSADDEDPIGLAAYQRRTGTWVRQAFGRNSLESPIERAQRILEEAAELAQAVGLPASQARSVITDVYAREPGDVGQEVGGLMVCIGALCEGLGVDMAAATEREMSRVEAPAVIAKCRRKNADKAARGVSVGGLSRNIILFGETAYEVSQAYAEGVHARRGGPRRLGDGPYPQGDERMAEWLNGYSNADGWDHFLPDGSDALDLFPDGRSIEAPDDPAPVPL
ncbi:hypothetical protein [Paracoccus sp. ME4]|uniref:hypothetical protein n=1 Tax=Paracoccus sp. ME4 TaxID=3138066 RepID=UPI00398AD7BB